MTLLRVHSKREMESYGCDPWERCPACLRDPGVCWRCEGAGCAECSASGRCSTCNGLKSGKAMVLAERATHEVPTTIGQRFIDCGYRLQTLAGIDGDDLIYANGGSCSITHCAPQLVRCEDCSHPMSEGTWERVHHVERIIFPSYESSLRTAEVELRAGREPQPMLQIHFSPCDKACKHSTRSYGTERIYDEELGAWRFVEGVGKPAELVRAGRKVEASWRPVDARRLSYDNDLRPEQTAVLCLRCFAERTTT